jgi:type II secretory pathway component GspD/PulD (secretin)
MLLFLAFLLPLSAWGAAGKIKAIEIVEDDKLPGRVLISCTAVYAYEEDMQNAAGEVLPEVTEKSVVVEEREKSLAFILDCIGLYGYKLPGNTAVGFVRKVTLSEKKGSQLTPDLMFSANGKEIYSAEITVETDGAAFYQILGVDRGKPGAITVRLAVQKADASQEGQVKSTAVISMTDVDLEPASVFTEDSPHAAFYLKILKQLEARQPDSFVTVMVPLFHIEPARAKSIVAHKLSLLGKIEVDADNPAILLTDRVDYIRSIVRTLPLLDRPTPQVSVEVKILEVTWRGQERVGFDWGNMEQGDGTLQRPFHSVGISPGSVGASSSGAGVSAFFGKLGPKYLHMLNAKIELLSSKGRVNLLANPRLVVQNNKNAKFHAGSRIPVRRTTNATNRKDYPQLTVVTPREGYEAESSVVWRKNTDQYTEESETRVEDFVNTGVELTLKPRISPSGEVNLELTPSVSEIAGWRNGSDIPIVQSREVTTTVRVSNGDTIFIGGLFKENEVKEESHVPGIGDLPGVGKMFRKESGDNEHVEVIFLLTIHLEP